MWKLCVRKTIDCLVNNIAVDLNGGKSTLYAWIGRFNIIKILILSHSVYKFKAMPIKVPPSRYSWSQAD